jgi:hypothetical protein
MSGENVFENAVEAIIERNKVMLITEGTVTAVDKEGLTCDVEREDLPELFAVRLNVDLEPGENIITVFPKKGSKVLCVVVENDETDCFVLTTNDIEEIIINGGENGGLTITPTLVEQLAVMSARIDTLENAIKDGVPLAQDGGIAYQQTMVAILEANQDVEDFSKIENEKIKH